jgi:hypothetical protein
MHQGENMLKERTLAVVCAAVLLWPAAEVHAQRMYRCGNAYQDRPCEGVQPSGKEVRNFLGSSAQPAKSTADAQCVAAGAESMKVSWARESGMTKEQQLANGTHDQWLIETVYLRRGTALEIRSAVEAACVAEKERRAAAEAAAIARALNSPNAPSSPAQGPSPEEVARFQERRDAEITANQEAFKKSRCDGIKRRYDDLNRQERAGGSSSTMQRLRDLRRDLDEQRRSEGC